MKLAILILAAGKSSRMGSIKQLLKINGKTLLENTIDISEKISSTRVICVLGANADEIKKNTTYHNVAFVLNKNYKLGLSSSIVSGVKYLEKEKVSFDGILILLADQPAIRLKYYNEMINLFSKEKEKIIASNYGNRFGVPAIFPKSFTPNLLKIKGDKGAKEFLQKNKSKVLSLTSFVNLLDIDTPEDYKDFISIL